MIFKLELTLIIAAKLSMLKNIYFSHKFSKICVHPIVHIIYNEEISDHSWKKGATKPVIIIHT